MELSRRDALAALAAAGAVAGGATGFDELPEHGVFDERDVETLVALADVLYPTELDGVESFVGTYAAGRADDRPEYAAAVRDAIGELDARAADWYGAPYRELGRETREGLLGELGCTTAEPDPGGTTAERLRYYLVNELLFALYTSPTGGRLVGLENPQGHPGGTASYQRGPHR